MNTAAYDGESRLKAIDYTDGSSVAHHTDYFYSADGFLARQVVDGVATRFVRDGFLTLQERDGANNVTRAYVWDPRAPGGISGLLELGQGGQKYRYLFDGKGNVNALLDGAGSLAATYAYDEFGNLMVKAGTLDQPFRFSTKPYDEKTGLSYYGYRFYSPTLGRWVNRDPLGERGGINLYGFVQKNPINWIDPWGLAPGQPPLYPTIDPGQSNGAIDNPFPSPPIAVPDGRYGQFPFLPPIEKSDREKIKKEWEKIFPPEEKSPCDSESDGGGGGGFPVINAYP